MRYLPLLAACAALNCGGTPAKQFFFEHAATVRSITLAPGSCVAIGGLDDAGIKDAGTGCVSINASMAATQVCALPKPNGGDCWVAFPANQKCSSPDECIVVHVAASPPAPNVVAVMSPRAWAAGSSTLDGVKLSCEEPRATFWLGAGWEGASIVGPPKSVQPPGGNGGGEVVRIETDPTGAVVVSLVDDEIAKCGPRPKDGGACSTISQTLGICAIPKGETRCEPRSGALSVGVTTCK